jgi:NAD(P)-dependent dehydrogenase (short-subunit alcohol dehydrogenase family)
MRALEGRVAIITGGGGGIGAATARRLVCAGAQVVIADIDAPQARVVADEIGEQAYAIHLDQDDESSVRSTIENILSRFGRIDILHNNAALTRPDIIAADRGVLDTDIAIWDAAYRTNLRGAVLCAKHVLPHMIAAGRGVIINMSSLAALGGDTGRTAYGSMKAAIMLLTQSIATAHGKQGVRCVALSPGAVLSANMRQHVDPAMMRVIERHHLTPYLGEPDDIAAFVAFVASDEARYLTGITIPIDGGSSSHLSHVADFVEMAG